MSLRPLVSKKSNQLIRKSVSDCIMDRGRQRRSTETCFISIMAVAYDTTFLISSSGKIFQSGKYFRSNQNGPKLEFLVIKNGTFIWNHFEQSLLSTAQGGAEFFSSFNQIWKAWFSWDFLSFGQDIWINKFKQGKKISQNDRNEFILRNYAFYHLNDKFFFQLDSWEVLVRFKLYS